jgi:hypothetical protein
MEAAVVQILLPSLSVFALLLLVLLLVLLLLLTVCLWLNALSLFVRPYLGYPRLLGTHRLTPVGGSDSRLYTGFSEWPHTGISSF